MTNHLFRRQHSLPLTRMGTMGMPGPQASTAIGEQL